MSSRSKMFIPSAVKSSLTPMERAPERNTHQELFDDKLMGKPLQEVDPYEYDATYCYIGKKHGKYYVFRFSAKNSLFFLHPLHRVRKAACKIVTSEIFDICMIAIIICNCITLALPTNWEIGDTGLWYEDDQLQSVLEILELTYLTVYTFEMIVKILAKGFVLHKFSYLRNAWNILDFFILIVSYASVAIYVMSISFFETLVEYSDNLDILKSFRVFRIIKVIHLLPGLRTILNALLLSVVQLLEVLLITFFCLLIFSLAALQLFMGRLRQKCVLKTNATGLKWQAWVKDQKNWLRRAYPFDEHQPCGNNTWARHCAEGYVCLPNIEAETETFDSGWTSFDNIGGSLLSTFQLITLDFWERLYDLVISASSPWAVIFFMIVIFFGSFYLVNLLLAVVSTNYMEEVRRASAGPTRATEKLSLHRKSSTFSITKPAKLNPTVLTKFRKLTSVERRTLAQNLRSNITIYDDNEQYNKVVTRAIVDFMRKISAHPEAVEKSKGASKVHSVLTNKEHGQSEEIERQARGLASPSSHHLPSTPVEQEKPEVGDNGVEFAGTINKLDTGMNNETVQPTVSPVRRVYSIIRWIRAMKFKMSPIMENSSVEAAMSIIIILNTLILASEHYDQPIWVDKLMANSDSFFVAVFTVEALIKLCALQENYFKCKWNLFDLFIVILNHVDLFVTTTSIPMVRGLRIIRVFKLGQRWLYMKVLLRIVFSTFGAVGNLVLFLVIVVYVFAVLGLQIIGREYTRHAFDAAIDEENFPRWNFQNFFYSFMMIFRVLCGEWIEPLLQCCQATNENSSEVKCFFIFIPAFIAGNFIVLNLFLALLLNSFDSEEISAQHQKELELSKSKNSRLRKIVAAQLAKHFENEVAEDSDSDKEIPVTSIRHKSDLPHSRFKSLAFKITKENRKAAAIHTIQNADLRNMQTWVAMQYLRKGSLFSNYHGLGSGAGDSLMEAGFWKAHEEPDPCLPKKCTSHPCWILAFMRHTGICNIASLRKASLRIVDHPFFEWFILALIFASSVTLCFEDVYLDTKPDLQNALFYLNVTFAAIFILEMCLKWLGYGLWTYFTSPWCLLDFGIILISVDSVVLSAMPVIAASTSVSLGSLKSLRTLRSLRPLRAISRWKGMKIVVNALLSAIPSIFNVLLVGFLFWLTFALMGVHLFRGKFFKCVENRSGHVLPYEIVQTRGQCCTNTMEWSWINTYPNFDNVFQAYLTLFQVATFEGWMEAMRGAVDSTEVDMQPKRDNTLFHYVYFVAFIIIGSFFTLNLIIGVIIDNFNRLKKQYDGSYVATLLTPQQQSYYAAMKKLGMRRPKKVVGRPNNKFLALCYDIARSRVFDMGIFTLLFLNLIVIGTETYAQREVYTDVIQGFNAFFTTFYIIEALVKVLGLRYHYFTVGWNIFDFVLVVASIADLAMDNLGERIGFPIPPTMLRIVRVFRIGQILRLFKAAKGIRKLLFALTVSLPALFNIGALLALIVFIYAVVGMSMFGDIAVSDSAIDDVFNFKTFLRSCMILLRLMTVAGWNDVLDAMMPVDTICGSYRKIRCGNTGEGSCANSTIATLYIVSYLLISYHIMINMYIAVILENFLEVSREMGLGIAEEDLDMFYLKWSRYDPEATQFINFEKLSEFLSSLDPPLCVPQPNLIAVVAFNLPILKGDKIHCLDILQALVRNNLGHIDDAAELRKIQEKMETEFRRQFPNRKLFQVVSSTRVWKIQTNAAVKIQRAWRQYQARKNPHLSTRANVSTRKDNNNKPKNKNFLQLLRITMSPPRPRLIFETVPPDSNSMILGTSSEVSINSSPERKRCLLCGKVVSNDYQDYPVHFPGNYPCEICHSIFKRKDYWKTHMKKQHGACA